MFSYQIPSGAQVRVLPLSVLLLLLLARCPFGKGAGDLLVFCAVGIWKGVWCVVVDYAGFAAWSDLVLRAAD